MTRREVERQLNILEAQLVDVHSKSERMVCAEYNVDSKQEAIDILEDELNSLNIDNEKGEFGESCIYDAWVDEAFDSVAEFDRMRV